MISEETETSIQISNDSNWAQSPLHTFLKVILRKVPTRRRFYLSRREEPTFKFYGNTLRRFVRDFLRRQDRNWTCGESRDGRVVGKENE